MRPSLVLPVTLMFATFGAASFVEAGSQDRAGAVRDRAAAMRAQRPAPPATNSAADAGAIPDQGVHNAVHAAHQNQIVFTRSDIGISAISEGDITTNFTLGQPMFFRVFTERSAVNAIAIANNLPARQVYAVGVHYAARFTINGQFFDTTIQPWGGRTDHETWTTWRGQFVNTNRFGRVPGSDAFLEMLSRTTAAGLLTPGDHTITMEVIPATNTENAGPIRAGVVARGTFTLSVPAGIFQASNPHVCGPVRGATASAALEARALSQARQYWDKPALTPVKAIGSGDEWDVTRNPVTGIPIERSTRVDILTRGAQFCTSQTHKFTEQYMGETFSTATGGISVNWDPGFVPCACLD